MTLDEYLAFEEQSVIKHEYVAGEVCAMAGTTTRHNLVTLNIARCLHAPARARGCKVFASDVKVHVADRIYYPDVMVACGEAANVDQIVRAPSLLIEVSSPSTRATDRREKLESYRRIPSLRTYLIVSQRRRHVLAYVRGPNDVWIRAEFTGSEVIPLPEIASRIALNEIYDGVDLPPLAVGEGVDDGEFDDWDAEDY